MQHRGRRTALLILGTLAITAGCYEEPVAITTFPPTPEHATGAPTATPASSPTPTAPPTATPDATAPPTTPPSPFATPPPAASPSAAASSPLAGQPGPGCVNGWHSPAPGTPMFDEGIAILERHMGVAGPWDVAELRYFIGPDAPAIIEPRYEDVERRYIRAALQDDPDFRGRWLLEKRTQEISGVSAVAPYDSVGYQSPDWTGFVGEGPPTTYLGLPGQWSGIAYNFVSGEGDSGQPGLPAEVVDCLTAG